VCQCCSVAESSAFGEEADGRDHPEMKKIEKMRRKMRIILDTYTKYKIFIKTFLKFFYKCV
jgi:hypothetical protein